MPPRERRTRHPPRIITIDEVLREITDPFSSKQFAANKKTVALIKARLPGEGQIDIFGHEAIVELHRLHSKPRIRAIKPLPDHD